WLGGILNNANRQKRRIADRLGQRVGPIDCPMQWDVAVASGQYLPPPMENPGLKAFTLAISVDGQPGAGLVGDPTPPQLFLEGITRPANSRRHVHLPD